MKSLRDLITEQAALTERQKQSLYDLTKAGKRGRNRDLLHSKIFNVPLSCWSNWGCYDRITFDGDCASYCANQSYTDEIREVSSTIIQR